MVRLNQENHQYVVDRLVAGGVSSTKAGAIARNEAANLGVIKNLDTFADKILERIEKLKKQLLAQQQGAGIRATGGQLNVSGSHFSPTRGVVGPPNYPSPIQPAPITAPPPVVMTPKKKENPVPVRTTKKTVPEGVTRRVQVDENVWVYDNNGALFCTGNGHAPPDLGFTWCNHVEHVVKDNLDGEWCFDQDVFMVPMFPTLGMWAEVRLDSAERTLVGRKLLLPVQSGGNFVEGLDFIGFLSEGEGRGVVRTLLYEWALPKWKPPGSKGPGKECASRRHGLVQQNDMIAGCAKSASYRGATMWSVVTEDLCLSCAAMLKDLDDWGNYETDEPF